MKDANWMVKLDFDLDLNCENVSSEIPYAYIDRTISPKTKLGSARWEHAGQKWVSIYDEKKNIGFSITNNGKYAYNVKKSNVFDNGTILRPTMLRTPKYTGYANETLYVNKGPNGEIDPRFPRNTDMEMHRDIEYRISFHQGDWRAGTWKKAQEHNLPVLTHIGNITDGSETEQKIDKFISINKSNVLCTVVKQWEDGANSVVFRLVEMNGENTQIQMAVNLPNALRAAAEEVDLLELKDFIDPKSQPVKFKDNIIEFTIGPYEIKTIKITF